MQPLSPLPKCEIGEPVVELRNVTKHYPIVGRSDAVQALKGICIGEGYPVGPIRKGEFIILRGPSGGGKTTLLNIIGCIDTVTSGSIGMLGHEITASASDQFLADLRLRSIGFVFQTFNLLGAFSAYATLLASWTLYFIANAVLVSNCAIVH
jgi:putative ABC transport system ATP-binding protein